MSRDEMHLAYISHMAAHCDYAVFGAICRGARANNGERGVAGVLLFDGQRFFQWLYGAADDVAALMRTIVADPRHERVSVCFESMLPPPAFEPHWRAGFVDAETLDAFAAIDRSDRAAVLEGMVRLVAQADLEPAVLVSTLQRARSLRPPPMPAGC